MADAIGDKRYDILVNFKIFENMVYSRVHASVAFHEPRYYTFPNNRTGLQNSLLMSKIK